MFFLIDNGELKKAHREAVAEGKPMVAYLTLRQLKRYQNVLALPETTVKECLSEQNRFRNSIDVYNDFSFGIINILNLEQVHEERDQAAFIIRKNQFIMIELHDWDESLKRMFVRTIERFERNATLEKIIYGVLDNLVAGGAGVLEEVENELLRMEEELVEGNLEQQMNKEIFALKNRLTLQKNYYEQLIDIGEELQEDTNEVFEEEELRYFKIFTDRVGRLSSNTQTMSENLIHLREALNAAQDYDLNRIMKVFTVVTTVFAPLTLLVGWYGMNFPMPEFGWKYSYVCVIILSIIIVIGCLIFFKKKKFI